MANVIARRPQWSRPNLQKAWVHSQWLRTGIIWGWNRLLGTWVYGADGRTCSRCSGTQVGIEGRASGRWCKWNTNGQLFFINSFCQSWNSINAYHERIALGDVMVPTDLVHTKCLFVCAHFYAIGPRISLTESALVSMQKSKCFKGGLDYRIRMLHIGFTLPRSRS